MTNRELDLLMKVAFGEGTEADRLACTELRKRNAEAEQLFRAYGQMDADLVGLNDIPECQLSVERMRTAILSAGVKPQRPSSMNWSLSLGLACVAALALWLTIPADRAERSLPVSTVASNSDATPQPILLESGAARATGSELLRRLETSGSRSESLEPAVMPAVRRPLTGRRPLASRSDESGRSRGESLKSGGMTLASAPDPGFGLPVPVADDAKPAGAPVVVVTSSVDPETGAKEANEVSNSRSVVFGG